MTVKELEQRVEELERQVQQLRSELQTADRPKNPLAAIEKYAGDPGILSILADAQELREQDRRHSAACGYRELDDEVLAVTEMTKAVFGQVPTVIPTVDPDFQDSYLVVRVSGRGTDEELVEQVRLWHRRFANEFATETRYSLSVDFE